MAIARFQIKFLCGVCVCVCVCVCGCVLVLLCLGWSPGCGATLLACTLGRDQQQRNPLHATGQDALEDVPKHTRPKQASAYVQHDKYSIVLETTRPAQ